jgi:pilus assembly protein Flp/PilA
VRKLLGTLRVLRRKDDGASAVEYGLLVALIAVIIAGTVAILGNVLQSKFNSTCDAVKTGQAAANNNDCTAP